MMCLTVFVSTLDVGIQQDVQAFVKMTSCGMIMFMKPGFQNVQMSKGIWKILAEGKVAPLHPWLGDQAKWAKSVIWASKARRGVEIEHCQCKSAIFSMFKMFTKCTRRFGYSRHKYQWV